MKYIDGIKDDQINASQFGRAMFGIMDMCTRLTLIPTKHIPVWEEVKQGEPVPYRIEGKNVVWQATYKNFGGKLYQTVNNRLED